jgi:Interferon-induced transmembrane protein/zinc-ribbon domain
MTMYCTNCGAPRSETALACERCGTPVQTFAVRPSVPNYLAPSIASTVCCCPPFGIVAIIYAAQVNSKLTRGDIPGAMAASRKARTWCWVTVGGGILLSLGYAALMFFNVAGSK